MSQVVAKKYLLNQSSANPGETVFTSTEGGDYRTSIMLNVTANPNDASITAQAGSVQLGGNAVPTHGVYQGSSYDRLPENGGIGFGVSADPDFTEVSYDLYVIVEELSAPQL